ncbi:fibroblast growth factor 9-like isoform X2 [Ptychodera flava]
MIAVIYLLIGLAGARPAPTNSTRLQTEVGLLANVANDEPYAYNLDASGARGADRTVRSTIAAWVEALQYRQLYCRSGYHLQIFSDGNISGTQEDNNRYAIIQFVSIHPPNTMAIRGVASGYYLAMNKKGRLYASAELKPDCYFLEGMLPNMHNTYESVREDNKRKKKKRGENRKRRKSRKKNKKRSKKRKKHWYVAFDSKGKPQKGSTVRTEQKMTHFLARPVDIKKVQGLYDTLVSGSS